MENSQSNIKHVTPVTIENNCSLARTYKEFGDTERAIEHYQEAVSDFSIMCLSNILASRGVNPNFTSLMHSAVKKRQLSLAHQKLKLTDLGNLLNQDVDALAVPTGPTVDVNMEIIYRS